MHVTSSHRQIQWANHGMTIGLGLSVITGVGVAILGYKIGGGELWRWCALGAGVAGVGEGVTLFGRAWIRYESARPMKGVEEAIGKLPHVLPGIPLPKSTLESYMELMSGTPSGEGGGDLSFHRIRRRRGD